MTVISHVMSGEYLPWWQSYHMFRSDGYLRLWQSYHMFRSDGYLPWWQSYHMLCPCGYLPWWQSYHMLCPVDICRDDSHITCSVPMDICGDDSHITCPVDICGDDSHITCYVRWISAVMTVISHVMSGGCLPWWSHTHLFMSGGYLRWWQSYPLVHVRWISAVMTVIPTCSCPVAGVRIILVDRVVVAVVVCQEWHKVLNLMDTEGKIEALRDSEMSVIIYQSTRHDMQEDRTSNLALFW